MVLGFSDRYLSGYLTLRHDFAPAHNLMAQVLEAEGDAENAVTSYKRSLELNSKQKDVLVKGKHELLHRIKRRFRVL